MISSHKLQALVQIWMVQVSVVGVLSAVGGLLGANMAFSVALGGLIYIIPNAYLAVQTYRATGARRAAQAVGNIYRGEMGKFALTIASFAAVFLSGYPVNVPALFMIYVVLVVLQAYQIGRARQLSRY